jgi:chemotaxis response regulator CheB
VSIRVLLADDSDVIRKVITYVLKNDSEIDVVGEASTFVQTIKLTTELRPQIVVIDLHMPDGECVTPLHVRVCLAGTRLLAMSLQTGAAAETLAKSFGALILLDKMRLAAELIPAIKLYAGDKAFAV